MNPGLFSRLEKAKRKYAELKADPIRWNEYLVKQRAFAKAYRLKNKARLLEKERQIRLISKERGECCICKKRPVRPNKTTCQDCANYLKDYYRREKAKMLNQSLSVGKVM